MRSPVIFCKKKIFLDERTIIIYNGYGRMRGGRGNMAVLDDFEPLEYYTKHLKQEFRQSAADYFDGLVKRSGVDEKLNAATVQKYNAAYAKQQKAQQKLNAANAVRGLTIALIVMALIAALVMIICYACGVTSAIGVLIGGIACFVVGIALIAVLCTAVKNYVGRRQKNYDAAAEKADRIKNEAFDQLRADIMEYHKQIEIITFDRYSAELEKEIEALLQEEQIDDDVTAMRKEVITASLLLNAKRNGVLKMKREVDKRNEVYQIMSYIEENLKDVTLSSFAAHFNLCEQYASRMIKEKTGQLFSAIVKRLRMETACQLLHNDRLTVKEIAYKVGYSSAEQFSRTFRDYYLMSPGAYRKSTGLV